MKAGGDFVSRRSCAVAEVFIDAEDIVSYDFADGCDQFAWRKLVRFSADIAREGEVEDVSHFFAVSSSGEE